MMPLVQGAGHAAPGSLGVREFGAFRRRRVLASVGYGPAGHLEPLEDLGGARLRLEEKPRLALGAEAEGGHHSGSLAPIPMGCQIGELSGGSRP
jgi:hypothetical protein